MLVLSSDFQSHLSHLALIFQRLSDAGLTVNPSKVKYAFSTVSFLGHILSPNGIEIDVERTRTIRDFPPPKDVKGVARFVGAINFSLNLY